MDKYEFNIVGSTIYSFIWNDFCDKYIELSKFNQNNTTKSVLLKVLTDILKMLHPFMPYVTEEIYQKLPIKEKESIMISKYPIYNKENIYNKETKIIDNCLEFITEFRNKKLELNIGNDYKVINKIKNEDVSNLIVNMLKLTDKLEDKPKYTTPIVVKVNDLEIDIDYDNSKNFEEELVLLQKEKEKLLQSIERRKKLLSNENYLSKAPEQVVSKEKEDLDKEEKRLQIVEEKLKINK